ncbi:hypothetical protein QQS21_009732 [Conoideocrella luteorostrata]|uniref:Uncharacterized protein n=1 Tax=Conoideocrella luteorostrata TaxID=1105319 RepID=A0AAJ0CJ11_9HYPO|nr:hypothetical protein QQS21_009732 [Conoideocrella luteorostrata]
MPTDGHSVPYEERVRLAVEACKQDLTVTTLASGLQEGQDLMRPRKAVVKRAKFGLVAKIKSLLGEGFLPPGERLRQQFEGLFMEFHGASNKGHILRVVLDEDIKDFGYYMLDVFNARCTGQNRFFSVVQTVAPIEVPLDGLESIVRDPRFTC